MKLPALLPEELTYCEEAQDDAFLLQILADKPAHLVLFFESACGYETWSLDHLHFTESLAEEPPFLERALVAGEEVADPFWQD